MSTQRQIIPRRGRSKRSGRRLGALLSMELLFVLPLVMGLLFALIEFSMLWSTNQLVEHAAREGCRIATFSGSNLPVIRRTVEVSLRRPGLVNSYQLDVQGGQHSGDDVIVTVAVPMAAAAPNLLQVFGFNLNNRTIMAQTVMRRE